MKKTVFFSLLAMSSLPAAADCLVELNGNNARVQFVENECREALKQCNRYKRDANMQNAKCDIVNTTQVALPDYQTSYDNDDQQLNLILNSMDVLQKAQMRLYEKLIVKPSEKKDHFLQLWLNKEFKGNYDSLDVHSLRNLKKRILFLSNHNHPLKSKKKLKFILQKEWLIQNMINGQFNHCSIEPLGNKHLLYVNGHFRGKFYLDVPDEEIRLRSLLADLIVNKVCTR